MWPISRLRRFAALSREDRELGLRALYTMVLVRVGLALLPFRRLRARIDRSGGTPGSADADYALAVRRAVLRAARMIPGSACLAQALTAEALLRRAGREARTSIGVALNGRPLEAHAWVESAGVLVTGEASDVEQFRTLLVFGSGVPKA